MNLASKCSTELIGNTPLVRLSKHLWAKLETFNLSGSIKDRIINYILRRACNDGIINKDSVLIEATSGNTGISLAAHGAMMGLSVKIIMPKNMSDERKKMLRLYGAEIIEVGDSDFEGAIRLRNEMVTKNDNYWSPRQFENIQNILCHRVTTAHEIATQLPRNITWEAFVSGAGTGGTLMGISQYAQAISRPDIKMIMAKPAEGPSEHGIQGINDGADFLVSHDSINEVIEIKTKDAKARASLLAKDHGLLVGISAGANVAASEEWIKKNSPKGAVVTILCDRGERYLSLL